MKKNNLNVWSSTADVLNDLKAVTGGNPGVSNLDDYVAVGGRPPPDRRESINEDEIQYQFGVVGNAPVGNTEPDLDGIAQMLHMIKDDPYTDNEPKTIFRNTMTDEISISKLNPNVTEFVPSSVGPTQGQRNQENKNKLKSPKKLDLNQGSRKKETEIKVSCQNKISDKKKDEEKITAPSDLVVGENKSTINELKGEHKHSATDLNNSVSTTTVSSSNITLDRKVDVTNMKSEEIEEMKVKVKSKIIDSSGESIHHSKKNKNVAIMTLLRLRATAPTDKPVKLITPDYYKEPPVASQTEEKESDSKDLNESVEELKEPLASTSREPVIYKDPFVEESIAKVNDWFDHEDNPKKKPLPVQPPPVAPVAPAPLPPVQFKDVLSFKKKNASSLSINSPVSAVSETNSEQKKKQFTPFVPSAYANDLLQKYETNAKSQAPPKEDWRDALVRKLKEKDEKHKKKRDAQDSPSDARGN